jgi:hypothetical protein
LVSGHLRRGRTDAACFRSKVTQIDHSDGPNGAFRRNRDRAQVGANYEDSKSTVTGMMKGHLPGAEKRCISTLVHRLPDGSRHPKEVRQGS